jgi:hypothetical protein
MEFEKTFMVLFRLGIILLYFGGTQMKKLGVDATYVEELKNKYQSFIDSEKEKNANDKDYDPESNPEYVQAKDIVEVLTLLLSKVNTADNIIPAEEIEEQRAYYEEKLKVLKTLEDKNWK